MSWCDKLASTPSMGLKLDYYFAPSDAILENFRPMLDKMVNGDKVLFNINQRQPFDIIFTTEDGFQYGVEASRVYVNFHHRLKAKAVSGGPPILEMMSHPQPYTELLPKVSDKLLDAALIIPGADTRRVTRIGVVAMTTVAEEELPPGLIRFIQYVGRPWQSNLEHYSFQITAEVDNTAGWTDRCVHLVSKPENPDELMTLSFDWQRTFTENKAVNIHLKSNLEQAQQAALEYFEDLAEGNRFDDDLIRASA